MVKRNIIRSVLLLVAAILVYVSGHFNVLQNLVKFTGVMLGLVICFIISDDVTKEEWDPFDELEFWCSYLWIAVIVMILLVIVFNIQQECIKWNWNYFFIELFILSAPFNGVFLGLVVRGVSYLVELINELIKEIILRN